MSYECPRFFGIGGISDGHSPVKIAPGNCFFDTLKSPVSKETGDFSQY